MIKPLFDWLDNRTGYRDFLDEALYEYIPGGARFKYAAGSMLVFAFVTQVITGLFLWMFYSPGSQSAWGSVWYIQNEVVGGWLLRGIHHFMAQAMVILLALHMLQVILDGAYKAPREVNYWLGLILLQVTLGLALTGYLLPWDQKGYWATSVATNLMSLVPLVGQQVQTLAVGGTEYGNLTLTRFFALHAGVLPAALVGVLALHLALFRKHGVTADTSDGRAGEYFWPKQVLFDSIGCLVVLALVVLRIVVPGMLTGSPVNEWGAELTAPADGSESFAAARPEWYFLFLFQLLKYFEGDTEWIGALLLPGLVMLVLFLMPLWGQNVWGHRLNVAFLLALLLGAAGLTAAALYQDNYALLYDEPPLAAADVGSESEPMPTAAETESEEEDAVEEPYDWWGNSRDYLDAIEEAKFESERFGQLVKHQGIPLEGPLALGQSDPLLHGRRLFIKQCASCHSHADENGVGIVSKDASAPNLYGFASRQWLDKLLDPVHYESDAYFGNTAHVEKVDGEVVGGGEMHSFLTENFNREDMDSEEKKALEAVVAALSAEAQRGDQVAIDLRDQELIERGRKVITGVDDTVDYWSCTDCHKYGDEGYLGDEYPDLTNYGSQEWLIGFISNPSAERFYGSNNDRMPAFAAHEDAKMNQLSPHDLEMIARWLRRDYPTYEEEEAPEAAEAGGGEPEQPQPEPEDGSEAADGGEEPGNGE